MNAIALISEFCDMMDLLAFSAEYEDLQKEKDACNALEAE